ncbi:MAG: DUF5928 domain-containing protein [Shimia sp.]
MVKIAYILLCHKDPASVIAQVERLTAAGDCVSIHFDGRAKPADFDRIRRAFADHRSVTFARRRIKCGWGEWSLVAATLEAVRAAVDAFEDATHFYMLSGDCQSIKSAEYAHAFLAGRDVDYIESFDYFSSNWIKTGMREERLIYRHYFNERTQKRRFYLAYRAQQRLGLERDIPADLRMMIGSQWWCLRRRTIEAILAFAGERRDVMRFFKTTWIPDETFFQTLTRHLVPSTEIETRTLTFLMFSDYGMPVTFYNDQYDMLVAQDYLFARKISPEAYELKARLGALYAAKGVAFSVSGEGRRLFEYVVAKGRNGHRFAPRFWETEASLGGNRELMVIVCKKWHVAKRLLAHIRQRTRLPCIEYLFNEEAAALPDLGGIQTTLSKRQRHRRALMRSLFDYYEADRLVVCMDPSNLEMMEDFEKDRSRTRILELDVVFTDEYLRGHAMRVGLAGDTTPVQAVDMLLPTLRSDLVAEVEAMRGAGFAEHFKMSERASSGENAKVLAAFLDIPMENASEIAETWNLFAD